MDRSEVLSRDSVVGEPGIDATIRDRDRRTGSEVARLSLHDIVLARELRLRADVTPSVFPATHGRSVLGVS